jgi:hypothetical protein
MVHSTSASKDVDHAHIPADIPMNLRINKDRKHFVFTSGSANFTINRAELLQLHRQIDAAIHETDPDLKRCPHCGSSELVGLTSQSIKICNNCKQTHDWHLSAGQKPLFDETAIDPDMEQTA